jgi:hypothetical protein
MSQFQLAPHFIDLAITLSVVTLFITALVLKSKPELKRVPVRIKK